MPPPTYPISEATAYTFLSLRLFRLICVKEDYDLLVHSRSVKRSLWNFS